MARFVEFGGNGLKNDIYITNMTYLNKIIYYNDEIYQNYKNI